MTEARRRAIELVTQNDEFCTLVESMASTLEVGDCSEDVLREAVELAIEKRRVRAALNDT